jgi:hypothetical protein
MLDLSDGQAAMEVFFMPDQATFTRGTTVLATDVPCGLAAASGDQADAGVVAQRGAFRLSLPVSFTQELRAQDLCLLRGHTYHVVWTPDLDSIALERVVGLSESS